MGAVEVVNLMKKASRQVSGFLYYLATFFLTLAALWQPVNFLMVLAGGLLVWAFLFWGECLLRKGEGFLVLENAALGVWAICYHPVCLLFLFLVYREQPLLALWLILSTKASDMGGYLFGRKYGKNPVAPRLSPAKSVEGTVAAVIASGVMAVLLSFWLVPQIPLMLVVLAGLAMGLLGFFGDLLESGLKRWARVKDSGTWLPQFGGVLDLIDSLLLAGPACYFILLLGKGGFWKS